jgi:hypothetical protein
LVVAEIEVSQRCALPEHSNGAIIVIDNTARYYALVEFLF